MKLTAIALWILTVLLAALYLFSGATKLAGMPMHVEHFEQWGYPPWFRLFVGAWEVVVAGLLLIPRTTVYGAAMAVMGMAGAVYTQLFRGNPPEAAFPAVLLVLVALLAYARRPRRATGVR